MRDFIISQGSTVFNTQMSASTLNDVIAGIQSDLRIAKSVKYVRSINDKKERSKYKAANLPFFNLGTFHDHKRLTQNFISSEFMIVDIDNLDDQQLAEVKNKLQNDNRVCIYFISPSGNGYKVVYRFEETITDSKKFSENYKYYAQQIGKDYGVETDKTSDSARACFFSHDPNLYINEDAECLEVKEFVETVETIDFTEVVSSISNDDEKFLPDAVECLRNNLRGYDDWQRAGMALASLGERGRSYFHDLSNNSRFDDTSEEIDDKFNNFLQTASGKIRIATLFEIAKNYGFTYSANSQPKPTPEVKEPFHELLIKQFEFDDNRDPNQPIGYKLTKFNLIEKELDGLQMGYYHLAADSNVGKSAFMHNLTLDLLESNDDLTVLFFSQDDPKLNASYRLIALLGELSIYDSKKGMQAIKNDSYRTKHLKKAREKYVELLKSERLVLMDTSDLYELDKLEEVVKSYYEKSKNIVVIIDGLYNLEVSSSKEGIRVENIERAKRIKRIVDTYQIPLITTGELRKKPAGDKSKNPTLDDLMESGKFAYNANIVWLLYAEDSTMTNATEVKVNLDYAKNKISGFKGKLELTFVRGEGLMIEGWASINIVKEDDLSRGITLADLGLEDLD